MTRINISIKQTLDLIMRAIQSGEVFVPKLNAYKVKNIIDVIINIIGSKIEIEAISTWLGEKFHEILIKKFESRKSI